MIHKKNVSQQGCKDMRLIEHRAELCCHLQGEGSVVEVSDDGEEDEDEEDADSEEVDDEEWDPSLATPAAGRKRRARSNSQGDYTVGYLLDAQITKSEHHLYSAHDLAPIRSAPGITWWVSIKLNIRTDVTGARVCSRTYSELLSQNTCADDSSLRQDYKIRDRAHNSTQKGE